MKPFTLKKSNRIIGAVTLSFFLLSQISNPAWAETQGILMNAQGTISQASIKPAVNNDPAPVPEPVVVPPDSQDFLIEDQALAQASAEESGQIFKETLNVKREEPIEFLESISVERMDSFDWNAPQKYDGPEKENLQSQIDITDGGLEISDATIQHPGAMCFGPGCGGTTTLRFDVKGLRRGIYTIYGFRKITPETVYLRIVDLNGNAVESGLADESTSYAITIIVGDADQNEIAASDIGNTVIRIGIGETTTFTLSQTSIFMGTDTYEGFYHQDQIDKLKTFYADAAIKERARKSFLSHLVPSDASAIAEEQIKIHRTNWNTYEAEAVFKTGTHVFTTRFTSLNGSREELALEGVRFRSKSDVIAPVSQKVKGTLNNQDIGITGWTFNTAASELSLAWGFTLKGINPHESHEVKESIGLTVTVKWQPNGKHQILYPLLLQNIETAANHVKLHSTGLKPSELKAVSFFSHGDPNYITFEIPGGERIMILVDQFKRPSLAAYYLSNGTVPTGIFGDRLREAVNQSTQTEPWMTLTSWRLNHAGRLLTFTAKAGEVYVDASVNLSTGEIASPALERLIQAKETLLGWVAGLEKRDIRVLKFRNYKTWAVVTLEADGAVWNIRMVNGEARLTGYTVNGIDYVKKIAAAARRQRIPVSNWAVAVKKMKGSSVVLFNFPVTGGKNVWTAADTETGEIKLGATQVANFLAQKSRAIYERTAGKVAEHVAALETKIRDSRALMAEREDATEIMESIYLELKGLLEEMRGITGTNLEIYTSSPLNELYHEAEYYLRKLVYHETAAGDTAYYHYWHQFGSKLNIWIYDYNGLEAEKQRNEDRLALMELEIEAIEIAAGQASAADIAGLMKKFEAVLTVNRSLPETLMRWPAENHPDHISQLTAPDADAVIERLENGRAELEDYIARAHEMAGDVPSPLPAPPANVPELKLNPDGTITARVRLKEALKSGESVHLAFAPDPGLPTAHDYNISGPLSAALGSRPMTQAAGDPTLYELTFDPAEATGAHELPSTLHFEARVNLRQPFSSYQTNRFKTPEAAIFLPNPPHNRIEIEDMNVEVSTNGFRVRVKVENFPTPGSNYDRLRLGVLSGPNKPELPIEMIHEGNGVFSAEVTGLDANAVYSFNLAYLLSNLWGRNGGYDFGRLFSVLTDENPAI